MKLQDLYTEIESNALDIECWYRGLKKYSISKLTLKDSSIIIQMNNSDSIVIEEKDNEYKILINKQLKYKNDMIDYAWIKEIYLNHLKTKGVKFL